MTHLSNLLSEISNKRQKYQKHQDPRKYVTSWIEDDVFPYEDQKVKALVIVLRTHGCAWANNNLINNPGSTLDRSVVGGCTMCGYINDCVKVEQNITDDDIIFQFNCALQNSGDKSYEFVKVFTSGSFLDDSEVSNNVRKSILDSMDETKAKCFLFETRPEFVSSDKLEDLKQTYNGNLCCSIGLESCNDMILQNSINKGFTFKDYKSAIGIIKNHDIFIKTYLLLKPPFLSEHSAIQDVMNSISILKEKQLTNCISINPVNVQRFTLIEYLFDRQEYRPPWLWSIVELLNKGSEIIGDSNIAIMSHPTAGGKRRGAHNCYTCDHTVLDAIKRFSMDNDNSAEHLEGLSCDCKSKWHDVLNLEDLAYSPIIMNGW